MTQRDPHQKQLYWRKTYVPPINVYLEPRGGLRKN